MKVRLTKDTDINGKTWKRGWVGGFDEAFAGQLIAEGKAVQVTDEARTFKFQETQTKLTECIPDSTEIMEQPQPKAGTLQFKKDKIVND